LLGPNNYPYLGGPLIDLNARRFAPATIAAFHDFFADQQGIQERFAAAAVIVAKRFRRARGVLGYEFMNEPFVLAAGGTQALPGALLRGAGPALRAGAPPPIRRLGPRHPPQPPTPAPPPRRSVPAPGGALRAAHLHRRVRRPRLLERQPGVARALHGARGER